jgi:hypothetical protein
MQNSKPNIDEMQNNLQRLFNVDINFTAAKTVDELIASLSFYINELINTNFDKLIFILYRMDVSEQKLKQLLANYPNKNAGIVVATLIVQRELQRQKDKAEFSKKDKNISDDEKW